MNPSRASDAAPGHPEPERASNSPSAAWERLLASDLADVRSANLYRSRQIVRPIDAVHVEIGGRRFVNFASNNYLGLTHHPHVIAASTRAAENDGTGSGAAALISGYTSAHASAEARLAHWKGTAASVLLSSGYQANHAAVQTIATVARSGGGARFLIDKLCHASLIDAVRASGAPFRVFPHNHLGKVRRLLETGDSGQVQVVVTESIFSMDGDAADLSGIAQLRGSHQFVWLLDEAHATGIYGPSGSGLAAEAGVTELVDVLVVTLSKALGGIGGAVCSSENFCETLVNHGRAFIFSTNLPPAAAATAEAAIEVILREPQRSVRVRALAGRVRGYLGMSGDSPIIPIILGTEASTLDAASRLRDQGMLVGAVRPPTVPRGSSRLRITLSCAHSDAEVDEMVHAVREVLQ
jgi:8-amino-7-oxononanoate synthase